MARWILFKNLLKELKTPKEKEDFIKGNRAGTLENTKNLYKSYDFLENYAFRKNKEFIFIYSPLALTEVFNVLFENHVLEYARRNFIPLSDVYELRKTFPEGTYDYIMTENKEYLRALDGHLYFYTKMNPLVELSGNFISEYGLLTHDAHLLAEAINADANYFITTDKELIEKFKNKKDYDLKVIFPDTFIIQFAEVFQNIKTQKSVKKSSGNPNPASPKLKVSGGTGNRTQTFTV